MGKKTPYGALPCCAWQLHNIGAFLRNATQQIGESIHLFGYNVQDYEVFHNTS